MFSSPVELVPFPCDRIDSVLVFGIWLQSGRSSVSGEGASKPQRDFPRVTAPRRAASKLRSLVRDRSSLFVLSRLHRMFFKFVFATSLWPSKGGQATALTGVPASSRGRASASATGEENGGCAILLEQQTKSDGGDPTVL